MDLMVLNFVLLSAISATILLMLYINIPNIQNIYALPPTGSVAPSISRNAPSAGNTGLPGVTVIDPDPTPYKCDTDTGQCRSKDFNIGDAVKLYADQGKVCKANTFVCDKQTCTCQWNNN
jgi:hypothetical protein